MSEKIKLVRNDTGPQVKIVVRDETTGQAVSLVGATASLFFRRVGTTNILATLTGVLTPGLEDENGNANSQPPYDVPGSGGRVVFPWGIGDLDQEPGEYEGEIEITFSDGTRQTIYDTLKFKLREDF